VIEMQSYYWWFKYIPPALRRVFAKGEPGKVEKIDPAKLRRMEAAADVCAASQRNTSAARARKLCILWSVLATVLLVFVVVSFLVWMNAIQESYDRGGRYLSPDRAPVEHELVLYASLASLAVLFVPAVVSTFSALTRKYTLVYRAAIVALVVAMILLFVDFLMLLSDTKGFSGLGTWAAVFTTVHIVFLIFVGLVARASRAVRVWSDIEA
jgi:hypothetical protein